MRRPRSEYANAATTKRRRSHCCFNGAVCCCMKYVRNPHMRIPIHSPEGCGWYIFIQRKKRPPCWNKLSLSRCISTTLVAALDNSNLIYGY